MVVEPTLAISLRIYSKADDVCVHRVAWERGAMEAKILFKLSFHEK